MITKIIAPVAYQVSRGQCRPFGSLVKPRGVNFAVFSRHARSVSLVLFMEGIEDPLVEIPLDPTINKTGDVWHIFVHDMPADLLYGYRVDGVFAPEAGHRFNPNVVLLDPYARALSGNHRWGEPDVAYGTGDDKLGRRCRLVVDDFDWEGCRSRSSTSCTCAASRSTRRAAWRRRGRISGCARRSRI
jgi:isoamylase